MEYKENPVVLGEDDDLSIQHAAQKGTHDAVSDLVRYSVLLGSAAMVAGIVFPKSVFNKVMKKVLK